MKTTVNNIVFEWDEEKNRTNKRKHHISFETAEKVFSDDNRIEWFDEEHSDEEDRYITLGMVDNILHVVYTERGTVIRLISARRADKNERRKYYALEESY